MDHCVLGFRSKNDSFAVFHHRRFSKLEDILSKAILIQSNSLDERSQDSFKSWRDFDGLAEEKNRDKKKTVKKIVQKGKKRERKKVRKVKVKERKKE